MLDKFTDFAKIAKMFAEHELDELGNSCKPKDLKRKRELEEMIKDLDKAINGIEDIDEDGLADAASIMSKMIFIFSATMVKTIKYCGIKDADAFIDANVRSLTEGVEMLDFDKALNDDKVFDQLVDDADDVMGELEDLLNEVEETYYEKQDEDESDTEDISDEDKDEEDDLDIILRLLRR